MKITNLKLKKPISIQGNGTSLWGESDGVYDIHTIDVEEWLDEDMRHAGTLEVFGDNTEWYQYTDRGVEKNVIKLIKPVIEKAINRKIEKMGWSEQGMQPDNGWNFDLVFKVDY